MGGIFLPPSVAKIESALTCYSAGNALEVHRLQHTLSKASDADLPALLTGLTYVTSRLHSAPDTAEPLRLLIDSALATDVAALAALGEPAVCAYAMFATNLVSADAAYVDPVLRQVVTRIFLQPADDHAKPLASLARQTVHAIVSTHARAHALLADAIRRRYPHPVRPATEHVAYARSVLAVARSVPHPALVASLVNAVFERLGAIEQLAAAENTPAAADKLQGVMLEVLRHAEMAQAQSPSIYKTCHLEALFAAYEAFLVPVPCTPCTPYVLVYACSLSGARVVAAMAERLRQASFDPSVSHRLRAHYLKHSAMLVMRAKLVSKRYVLVWLGRLGTWLNAYVDALDQSPRASHADVDVHHVFYMACAVLMATMCRRRDAFAASQGAELMARLRLYRIVNCAINPLNVLPRTLVDEFVDMVRACGGADLRNMARDHMQRYVPTRTKFGSPNMFSQSFQCPNLNLQLARAQVDRFVRWDEDKLLEKTNAPSAVEMPTAKPLVDMMDVQIATPTSMLA